MKNEKMKNENDKQMKNDLQFLLSNEHDITKLKIARQQMHEYYEQHNVDDIDDDVMNIDTTIESLIETNEIAKIEFLNKYNIE